MKNVKKDSISTETETHSTKGPDHELLHKIFLLFPTPCFTAVNYSNVRLIILFRALNVPDKKCFTSL